MARRGGYDDDDDDDMLMKALQMSEPCGNCGKQGAQIPCMSGCGEVFYCSRECNMFHASSHRLQCRNLRCPKINDSESEEDSSDESYDSSYSDESSEEEEQPPPSKGRGGGKQSKRESVNLKKKESGGGGGRVRVDSDIERRIEEKILRRLRKQEENRIAQAIEAQMAQANATWTDEDMNRIAMEVKNRLQKEMGHMFMNGTSRSRKNSVTRESLLSSRQIKTIVEEKPEPNSPESSERSVAREITRVPSSRGASKEAFANGTSSASLPRTNSNNTMKQASSKTISTSSSSRNIAVDVAPVSASASASASVSAPVPAVRPKESSSSSSSGVPVEPSRPVVEAQGSSRSVQVDASTTAAVGTGASASGPPPAWNNKCAAFLSLKIVVWKLDFLPQLKFAPNDIDGTWNKVVEVDADESFSHVVAGDLLMSLNGQHLTGLAVDEHIVQEMLQMAHGGHLILKFSTTKPVNTHVREYSVRWGNGPLGLTLKDDGSPEALPIVHRLTKKPGSVAVKENIAIGDVLCSINNIDTVQLGCALTMSVLKKVQLPATLTFRGVGGIISKDGSSSASNQDRAPTKMPSASALPTSSGDVYTVNWNEGPLGLTIIPGISSGDLPVIKRVTGKGESPGIEFAQVGDCLLSVNGKSTASLSFENIVEMMKTLPKPIYLEFRASKKTYGAPREPAPQPDIKEVARKEPARNLSPPPAPQPTEVSRPSPPSSTRTLPTAPKNGEVDIDVPVASYTVLWGADGPLGLTIDSIPHSTGAFIKRSNGTGAAAHLSEDCIGDEMTHINDIDVTQMEYSRIVSYLKKVPRPVTLRFKKDNIVGRDSAVGSRNSITAPPASVSTMPRSQSSLRPESASAIPTTHYDLAWTEGSLGLSLHAADDKSEYPYITRVTGVGCAAHLPSTVVGDQLRYINGNSCHVSRMSFNDIMEMLKTLPKPIQLRFQKNDEAPRTLAPRSNSNNGTFNSSASNGSFNTGGNGSFNTGGDDDATNSSHNMLTPFVGAPKLSTGRRQKIVKQLKK